MASNVRYCGTRESVVALMNGDCVGQLELKGTNVTGWIEESGHPKPASVPRVVPCSGCKRSRRKASLNCGRYNVG